MATLTKAGTPSLATYLPPASCQTAGLLAGEDLAAGDACYIKSDGKVWRSTGTAVAAAARCDGFAAMATKAGEAVTLFFDVVFRYATGLTPGERVYVSATAGALDDAATTGGTAPVGYAIDATRVMLRRSTY